MAILDLGKVRVTWLGAWVSTVNYENLDAVEYDGSTYIALGDINPGLAVPSLLPASWQLLALKGKTVEMNVGTVATIASSSPATVTVTQVDNVATIDFQIPVAVAPQYSVSGTVLTITQ